jgi:hypothetical protein
MSGDIILGSITLVGLGYLFYAAWSARRVRQARSPYSGACPCGCADATIPSQELTASTLGRAKDVLETPAQIPAEERATG